MTPRSPTPPQSHFTRLFDVVPVEFGEVGDIAGAKNSQNYDIGMTGMSYTIGIGVARLALVECTGHE